MNSHLVISIVAILLYSAFCLYIGMGKGYDKKTVSTARGYFLGEGTGFVILVFTTVATWFSTWIFMGAPGSFFTHGVGWIAGMTWQVIILLLMGNYGSKFWRMAKDKHYVTPADMLHDYYGSVGLRRSMAIGQLAFVIPNLLAQVSGVGLAVTALTGGYVPFWLACLYAAGLVGIYVYYGGFKSQAWVDTAQAFMFIVILWGSVFILLTRPQIAGLNNMFRLLQQANENLLHFFTDTSKFWNYKTYISFALVHAFGGYFAPHVWQRMYAAKNGKTVVRMSGVLGPFYCFILLLPALLIGFAGRVLGLDPANSDSILVVTLAEFAPLWGILVVIGILAAGMSTISSLLVSATSILSVDFIQQAKPDMDQKTLRNVGRYCVLLMLAIAVISSQFRVPGIAMLMNMSMSGFSLAFWPVFGIFTWKRMTGAGAFWGYTIGTLVVALFYAFNYSPLGFHGGFWGFLLTGAVTIGVSLATEPYSAAHRREKLEPLARTATKPDSIDLDVDLDADADVRSAT